MACSGEGDSGQWRDHQDWSGAQVSAGEGGAIIAGKDGRGDGRLRRLERASEQSAGDTSCQFDWTAAGSEPQATVAAAANSESRRGHQQSESSSASHLTRWLSGMRDGQDQLRLGLDRAFREGDERAGLGHGQGRGPRPKAGADRLNLKRVAELAELPLRELCSVAGFTLPRRAAGGGSAGP